MKIKSLLISFCAFFAAETFASGDYQELCQKQNENDDVIIMSELANDEGYVSLTKDTDYSAHVICVDTDVVTNGNELTITGTNVVFAPLKSTGENPTIRGFYGATAEAPAHNFVDQSLATKTIFDDPNQTNLSHYQQPSEISLSNTLSGLRPTPAANGLIGRPGMPNPKSVKISAFYVFGKVNLDPNGQKGGQGGQGATGYKGLNGNVGPALVPTAHRNSATGKCTMKGHVKSGTGINSGYNGLGGAGGKGGKGGSPLSYAVNVLGSSEFDEFINLAEINFDNGGEGGTPGDNGPLGTPGNGGPSQNHTISAKNIFGKRVNCGVNNAVGDQGLTLAEERTPSTGAQGEGIQEYSNYQALSLSQNILEEDDISLFKGSQTAQLEIEYYSSLKSFAQSKIDLLDMSSDVSFDTRMDNNEQSFEKAGELELKISKLDVSIISTRDAINSINGQEKLEQAVAFLNNVIQRKQQRLQVWTQSCETIIIEAIEETATQDKDDQATAVNRFCKK